MKNKLLVLLSLLLCFSMIFVFASCGRNEDTDTDTNTETETETETETDTATDTSTDTATDTETDTSTDTETEIPECATHTYGDWTVVNEKTCTADGLEKRVCSVCSSEETQPIPMGHDEGEWETVTELTCTTNGLMIKECSTCGEELDRDESIADGHKMGVWEDTQELTCEQDGIKTRVCSVCGESEQQTTTAEGHDEGEWETTQQLSCTQDGIQTQYCNNCNEKIDEKTITAMGHQWTEWGIGWDDEPYAKEATCTEEGYLGRVCNECGGEETQTIPLAPHPMGGWIVPDGVTCETGGTVTRECTACTYTETNIVAAGDHVNVVYEGAKEATKEEDGSTGVEKCLACGKMISTAKTIRYVNVASGSTVTTNVEYWALTGSYLSKMIDGNHETGVCSFPKGTSISDTITFTKATNVIEVVLVVNGKGSTTEGANYSEVTNNEYTISFVLFDENGEVVFRSQEYNTLDKIEISVDVSLPEGKTAKSIQITRSKAAYTDKNYLWEVEVYNKEYLSPCDVDGHAWSDWQRTDPYCTQDALVNGLETRTCAVCGEVEENVLIAAHTWSEWNIDGLTCSVGGTKTRNCTACGKQESETVEADGHINVVLQGVKEPTLEEAGHTGDYVCTVCGETVEAGTVIPMLVNYALDATPSTNSTFWGVVGNGSWAPNSIPNINDGNLATGANTLDGTLRDIKYILTWENAVGVDDITVVCNGTGNLGYKGDVTDTNYNCAITINVYDENGTVIKTISDTTADKTAINIEFEETTSISKIEVTLSTLYGGAEGAIFEIMAIGSSAE